LFVSAAIDRPHRRRKMSPFALRIVPVPFLLIGAIFAAPQPASRAAGAAESGKLEVDDKSIQLVSLLDDQGQFTNLPSANTNTGWSLRPGRYRLYMIELKGGYRSLPDDEWITVPAGRSVRLEIGLPLTPSVKVCRRGSELRLDCELFDTSGRKYTGAQNACEPGFAVFLNDEEIGRGKFRYG
jgi:hypothetical protein